MKEEKNQDSPTGTWEWVDPDLVNLEGPYSCPNCGFHIGIDSTYLDQDSKVVVCPNCETEAPVPDSVRAKHIKREGQAEMMVWCEACGPGIEINPGVIAPDTSVKSAKLLLNRTIRMMIGSPAQVLEMPNLVETLCTKCGTRRTVSDKVAVNIIMDMMGAKHTSDMFRKLQQLTTASATNKET